MVELELGKGDKIVTDIYDRNGEWAGIAISDCECPVGEFIDTGAENVGDLEPHVIITTNNPKSLDVIIAACGRAKDKLKEFSRGS